jgi:hypothetical protein
MTDHDPLDLLIGRELTKVDRIDGAGGLQGVAVFHFGDTHRLVIHSGATEVQGHVEIDYDEGEPGPWDRDPQHVTGGV